MSLNVCDSGHEEICYTDWECPACILIDKIEELEDKIDDLEQEKSAQ